MVLNDETEIKTVSQQMYRLLRSKGVTEHLAHDLVQEALIKVLVLEKEIPPNHQKAFLFKVVMNEFYMDYRKNKRLAFVEEFSLVQSGESLMEELMIAEEQRVAVQKVLQQLPENYRKLLQLKYEVELSYKAMAEYLELPETHIKTYLQRARKAFKEKWRENND